MAADTELKPGTRVRFTASDLGTFRGHAARFSEVIVHAGETGVVSEEKVGPALVEAGWIFIEPDGHEDLICPVHPSMIEVI